MVRKTGNAAVVEQDEDIEDLTVTAGSNGHGDAEDLVEETVTAPAPTRSKRTISPEQAEAVFEQFRNGSSVANAAREADISWDLLSRYLQLGGFKYSDSRMAQAARILAANGQTEEPFYTFAQQAEAAWDEGAEARGAKVGGTSASTGPRGYKPKNFNEEAAATVLEQIGNGSTLNAATRQAGLTPTMVIGWLRAGGYPGAHLPGGRPVDGASAPEPFRTFANDFAAAEQAGPDTDEDDDDTNDDDE